MLSELLVGSHSEDRPLGDGDALHYTLLVQLTSYTHESPSLRRGTLKGVPNCTKNSFVIPGHRVAKVKRAGISTSSGTGDGSCASKYDGQARGWDN